MKIATFNVNGINGRLSDTRPGSFSRVATLPTCFGLRHPPSYYDCAHPAAFIYLRRQILPQ
jgi:hypothetical protein